MRTRRNLGIRHSAFGIRGLIAGLLVLISGQVAMAQNGGGDQGGGGGVGPGGARHAPRRILVRLWTADDPGAGAFSVGGENEDWRHAPEPNSIRAVAETLIEQATGGRVLHRFWFVPGLEIWEVDRGFEAERAVAAGEVPWVNYSATSRYGQLAQAVFPDDPAYQAGYQWGIDRICMPQAWEIIRDCSQYPIAIVDSGVDYSNPQLTKNILVNSGEPLPNDGWDSDGNGYVDDHWGANVTTRSMDCTKAINCDQTCEGDPAPGANGNQHGTFVAGVAGAVTEDCRSIAGLAFGIQIVPIKITPTINPSCGFLPLISTVDISLAFEYAIERGARIVNCSWGVSDPSFNDYQALLDAFQSLYDHDVVAVVAASNSCSNIDSSPPPTGVSIYPALFTFPNIIVVGASNSQDNAWAEPPPQSSECGSNYGDTSVDLFAPGENIRTFSSDSTTACSAVANGFYVTGTSFASPHVAGVAALVWARYPSFSAVDVVSRIRSTARVVPALSHLCVSGGVLDASAAVGGSPCVP